MKLALVASGARMSSHTVNSPAGTTAEASVSRSNRRALHVRAFNLWTVCCRWLKLSSDSHLAVLLSARPAGW